MNINEELSELGKIGGVGYSPTDATVDDLVGRTRQTRGRRQITAALVGSVGAVALGIIGAQVFVGITGDDAAGRNRAFDDDYAFLSIEWSNRYGEGYTGLGVTQNEMTAAWDQLQAGALVKPAVVSPAEGPKPGTAACSYEEREWNGGTKWRGPDSNCQWVFPDEPDKDVPAGWIDFGGTLGQCKNYTDAATGATVFAAFIDAGGSYKKIVRCEGGPTDYWSGSYQYIYNGPAGDGWHATLSGTTCTGFEKMEGNDLYQYSCKPGAPLWKYIRTIEPEPEPTPTVTPTETPTPEPDPEPSPTV